MLKLAIISGFLGSVRNRFMDYQEPRELAAKAAIAGRVENLSGLELCYPEDFADFDLAQKTLAENKLGVSAVNFRSRRNDKWVKGSFTSSIPAERTDLVEELARAAEYARKLGCKRITTCPLNEGHDYIFEMPYGDAYDLFRGVMREAADGAKDIAFSLEYKWNDPRARCLLAGAGEALSFCEDVDRDNVGVTLDFGHSIYAGERPAQAAVLLSRANRLFYVHLNDNDKYWDWDMMPGAFNFWDSVEFFYYLKKIGYDDWYAYDVTPKDHPVLDVFNTTTFATLKLKEVADRIDVDGMEKLLGERNAAKTMRYLFSLI
ncbi:MAG: sugar phosphate isomerase/epimerase [Planctomycetota bacterium]|jgi:xylose isomerase|nr:sugar phosphate isomerase/epimerase [Planctomycetota bacterium]